MHRQDVYFPLMLNYTVCFRKIDTTFVVSALKDYEKPKEFEFNTVEGTLNQLKGHFKLIKELGFNSVRIVGLNILWSDDKNNNFLIPLKSSDEKSIPLNDNIEVYLNRIEEIVRLAEEFDLRIMILLRHPENDELLDLTRSILLRFKDEPTIFAYDFFNEPLYFDNVDLPPNKRRREKEDAIDIVSEWKDMIEEYAPNQLMTIGFSEPLEVFEWDPSILPVDFLAFHTYHPLRVPNEIYWYSKYTNKPWMIGETALPADNDSVPYTHQTQFLHETFKRVVNCGGIGFGWWSFQDVSWGGFEHDYTSLLNHEGETWTSDSSHKILGTLKPAAFKFKNLKNYVATQDCPCWVNYKNMLGYENFIIRGKIVDNDNGEPVEGAVIRGWSPNWRIGANTFSDVEGNFSLYTNTQFLHFVISAPGMSTLKFDFEGAYKPIEDYNEPLDSLKNKDLEYHKISYIPFLVDDSIKLKDSLEIFKFKKEMFNQAKYEAIMETKELKSI